MKVKIYEFTGSYGAGITYFKLNDLNEKDICKNDTNWEYRGIFDLPEDFIDKCLPAYYIE